MGEGTRLCMDRDFVEKISDVMYTLLYRCLSINFLIKQFKNSQEKRSMKTNDLSILEFASFTL